MKAGRELDALIAEKVMGLGQYQGKWLEPPRDPLSPVMGTLIDLPHYSTNIAAAWQVVEKLIESKKIMKIQAGHMGVWISISIPTNTLNYIKTPPEIYSETAPHAICLAALKAVGVEV